jgi:N-acetylglucosamine kinase-like BadF-type ATPase
VKKVFFFGIDGGGTHSRMAIMNDAGKIIARVEAGSTNIYSVPKKKVFANLQALLNDALKASSLIKDDLAAGCMGSAGIGRQGEQKLYRAFFDKLLGRAFPVKLCTDGEILLVGGLRQLEGYCLIAGTGSLALGRTADGKLVRSGGHGYLLGDEGSAAWIGRTAIARCLRSLEGRDLASSMLVTLLAAAKLEDGADLIRFVHHDADKAAIAALAPAVTVAAREGDPLALDILRIGAAELTLLVRSVLQRSREMTQPVIVLAGGVIEHDEVLTGMLKERLTGDFPALTIAENRGSALEGACMLAMAEGIQKVQP